MQMTKKLLVVLVVTAMLLLVSVGCKKAPVSIDGEALYEQMSALGQFPEMARRSDSAVYDYYGIDPAECKQIVNYASADGLMTDEFLLVETNDPAYAEEVETMLKNQIAYQAETYREYMPEEYPKISNARIERNGCYVLVIIAQDVDALYRLYTDALK
jgi:hypothetical protein